jgi:tetratricopeptide (TPR) repeat protein
LLKKNPKDTGSWIELGAYQKMIGDYDGATISWSYVNKIAPTDYVSLGNLGNLFAYYLHDNLQSEKYYKQAIVNGPTQVYLYVQLAEIYRDIWGDKPRAIAILEQGLAKNPGDENLTKIEVCILYWN